MDALLALDQGTTSTRAILFDTQGQMLSMHSVPTIQSFPQAGWVEQSPKAIWESTREVLRQALSAAQQNFTIHALGITNQRETTVVWDKKTGEPLYPAISWQDRRTQVACEQLRAQGLEALIRQKTGLVIDPYFSGLKVAWILDHIQGARKKAQKGEVLFGTIDSYLLWCLTRGQVHATDATNASRTMLFNIQTCAWDSELCEILNVPMAMLPTIQESASLFGHIDQKHLDLTLPITGMIGDQQSASLGQACIEAGDFKSTYGTGCFMLMNTGAHLQYSEHRLLSTIAYQIHGKVSYALEGSIFMAGAIIQWLRDSLHLLPEVSLSDQMASQVPDDSSVIFLPAMTGLGAPFWDATTQGAVMGLTPGDGDKAIVRAALESVCFQTKVLLETFLLDVGHPVKTFKVDGGMSANDWLLQALSDTLGLSIQRPQTIETTALGAAFLAGLGAGVYHSLEQIQTCWQPELAFAPTHKQALFNEKYHHWLNALATLSPKVNAWLDQSELKRQVQ